MKRSTVTMLACLLASAAPGLAQTPSGPPPDPRATDPIKLGWMVGLAAAGRQDDPLAGWQLLPLPAVALELLALARAACRRSRCRAARRPSTSCRAPSARISTP